MIIGILANEMTADFDDVLAILNLLAITLLLTALYIEEIAAGSSWLLKRLNPLALLVRLRLWLSAHDATD